MRRRDDVLDPHIARELDELEAALAGDPAADPQLLALVSDVRDAAPRMSPSFAAGLDRRVAAGFPRARSSRLAPKRLLPALGVAASLAVGAVIISQGGDGERPASVGEQSGAGDASATAPAIAVAPPVAQDTVAPPAPQASAAPSRERRGSPATPSFGRKVQRAAQLTLTTSPAKVQDIADNVVKTTQSLGGVVQEAKISTSDTGGRASFTLRIPSARLAEAIRELSDLAHVGSLDQDATDITGSFVSAADRLSGARAERKALLRALGRATTTNEIASLRRRVELNASEIAARKGELNALRRRANLSTVSVVVAGSDRAKDDGAGGWSPSDAAGDALRVLEVAVGAALVALAVLAPLAILAGVAALGARATRRRRREAALDIG